MNDLTAELNAKLVIDGTKIGFYKDRVEAWHRGERVAPITMDVAFTRRCLSPDSRVAMGDGTHKRIADIYAGDLVASSDEYGAIRKSIVLWAGETAPRKRLLAIAVGDEVLRCTADHPILTRAGWVEAWRLKVGDYVAKQAVYGSRKTSEAREDVGMVGGKSEGEATRRTTIRRMEQDAHVLSRSTESCQRTTDINQQDESTLGRGEARPFGAYESTPAWSETTKARPCLGRGKSGGAGASTSQSSDAWANDRSREARRQREDAREQSYEVPRSWETDGGYADSAARGEAVSVDEGTLASRSISASLSYFGRGTQSSLGEDDRQQSDEGCFGRSKSRRHQQSERLLRSRIEADEAELGGREDYVSAQAHGRRPAQDQSDGSPLTFHNCAVGAEVHRRCLILADGDEEWEVAKPGFRVNYWRGEDSASPTRGLLAQAPTGGHTSRDGRLFWQGLEGIYPVAGEPSIEAAYHDGYERGLGVVVWRQIESVSDAGYSPVHDLECVPYHNFIASGIVVHNCNAACSFCAAKTQASASPSLDIPKDIAFGFLEDAAEIGVKGISLISDGESTLVDYYAESIEYAAKLGIKIGLGTNGIALDRELLERILPHVSYLRFNFSAGERKRYSEIMGVKPAIYDKVLKNIGHALDIVKSGRADTNINMNLVCDPKDSDQLMPFALLAKQIGVHYAVIKHCATDDGGMIQINYDDYAGLADIMRECEALSAPDGSFRVTAKWNRFDAKRQYHRCYGPQFILQMSGNGLIATCGPFFNERYKAFHIGNVMRTRFIDIFNSERYWEVMRYIGSEHFDPATRCPPQCLQHHANQWLYDFKAGKATFPITPAPPHIEFI